MNSNIASWNVLEELLTLPNSVPNKNTPDSDLIIEWPPVTVSNDLRNAIRFVASSKSTSQFLQEWLLENIFQDLRKNVRHTFWSFFTLNLTRK